MERLTDNTNRVLLAAFCAIALFACGPEASSPGSTATSLILQPPVSVSGVLRGAGLETANVDGGLVALLRVQVTNESGSAVSGVTLSSADGGYTFGPGSVTAPLPQAGTYDPRRFSIPANSTVSFEARVAIGWPQDCATVVKPYALAGPPQVRAEQGVLGFERNCDASQGKAQTAELPDGEVANVADVGVVAGPKAGLAYGDTLVLTAFVWPKLAVDSVKFRVWERRWVAGAWVRVQLWSGSTGPTVVPAGTQGTFTVALPTTPYQSLPNLHKVDPTTSHVVWNDTYELETSYRVLGSQAAGVARSRVDLVTTRLIVPRAL